MTPEATSKRPRWPRRKPRCWQCLATISPADPYCPHCGAGANASERAKTSRKKDGDGGLVSPLSIFLLVFAVFGGIGVIVTMLRDSAGSSGGQGAPNASSLTQPTATARTVSTDLGNGPLPTAKPERLKQRSPRDIPADAVLGTVATILTGDTLEISVGGRTQVVHLAAIDAPEPATISDECYGDEAKERLGDLLIEGMPIWVSPDPAKLPATASFEGYAWTWDILGRNPRFVNEVLVRGGFARFSPPAPDLGFDEPKRLLQAQADAKSEGDGLWGSCL